MAGSPRNLLELPPDVMSPIMEYLDAYYLYQLWRTSKSFQRLVEQRKIVQGIQLRTRCVRRAPHFFVAFRDLVSIDLKGRYDQFVGLTPSAIRQWPQTLEKIRLNCFEASMAFFEDFELPSSHWKQKIFKWRYLEASRSLKIAELFPKLRHIELRGRSHRQGLHLLSLLPMTVHTIFMELLHADQPLMAYKGSYPTSLTSLDLHCDFVGTVCTDAPIPSTLLHLGVQLTELSSLPANLVHLESLNVASGENFDFSALLACTALSTLTIYAHRSSSMDSLMAVVSTFKSLRYLRISRVHLRNKDIPLLPRSLTQLEVSTGDELTPDYFQYFPPFLQRLSLYGPYGQAVQADERLLRLPASLTFIYLSQYRFSNATLQYHPKGTVNLLEGFYTSESVQNFPKKLTTLCIFDSSHRGNLHLQSEQLRLLPPLLTSFDYYGTARNWEAADVAQLPQSLLRLYVPRGAPLTHEAWKCLPPKLTQLYISQADNMGDDCLAHLPRTLQSLHILGHSDLGRSFVPHLPPNLKKLTIKRVESWTDDDMALLPRHLTDLVTPRLSLLTDRGFRLLPDSITSLTLSLNRNFTHDIFRHLPSQLVSLYLQKNLNIKRGHIPLFPPFLEVHTKGLNYVPPVIAIN